MPIVMNPRHVTHHETTKRSTPQKVCISLGVAFIIIGFVGVLMPGLLGMHLSMVHNLVHIVSGAVALWAGYANTNRAIGFCLWGGAVYGFLGIAGFVLGEPGYPGVGNMEADQNLFRVIPEVLEFGTMDHIVHLLISTFLLFTAFTFRKDRTKRNSNVNRLNRRSTLGSSDFGK